jgi:hypothetical protein
MSKQANTGVVNIRGKEYKTVALRVQEFYEGTEDLSILTEIMTDNETRVVMKASIVDRASHVLATGHAEEFRGSTNINRTSALENAETSAIGRALAAFGFGGSEFASANEVQVAIAQQNQTAAPEKVAAINSYLESGLIKAHHLERSFGHCNVPQLLDVEADRIINGVNQSQQGEQ